MYDDDRLFLLLV